MPVITKITIQKKNQSRYNLFLDHVYAFSVDEDVLIRFQLKKGNELTEEDVTRIQYEDEIRKAFHSAIQFLSFRMRSGLEIKMHLQKKEWPDSIIGVVIQELTDRKYIDDFEFAKAYVRTYANSGKKGPLVIKQELQKKGIAEEKIHLSLCEYNKEKQVIDAIQLGNKYAVQNKKLSERMLKQKVEYTLATKGFPGEIIQLAMEEISYEKSDETEWDALKKEADKAKRRYKKYSGFEYSQRIKQALFRKGFKMELINKLIEDEISDEAE